MDRPIAEMYVIGAIDYVTELGGSFLNETQTQLHHVCGESFAV